jgi:undecaprenyl diphosphate synthase
MTPLKHIAIIMDGNGRWAQLRSRPRTYGHIKGARVAKKIITAAVKKNIAYLTLYAFSSENWLRPQTEVLFLMNLLRRYLRKETATLMKQNIRFRVIGDLRKLPTDVLKAIDYAEKTTATNTGMALTFALSYGSRQEIADAARALAAKVQAGTLPLEEVNEASLDAQLQSRPSPDPDLIIRTSGECRLSNFLLWQAAYSEFFFSNTLWPDFTEDDLDIALLSFHKRERRFGAINSHENSLY